MLDTYEKRAVFNVTQIFKNVYLLFICKTEWGKRKGGRELLPTHRFHCAGACQHTETGARNSMQASCKGEGTQALRSSCAPPTARQSGAEPGFKPTHLRDAGALSSGLAHYATMPTLLSLLKGVLLSAQCIFNISEFFICELNKPN